jgi:hypothetical protein
MERKCRDVVGWVFSCEGTDRGGVGSTEAYIVAVGGHVGKERKKICNAWKIGWNSHMANR